LIGYEKDDDVGVWYSSHFKSEIDAGLDADCGLKVTADARHYELETQIVSGTDVEGSTTFYFTPQADGIRVLDVGLLPTLRIEEVVRLDPAGGEPEPLRTPASRSSSINLSKRDKSPLCVFATAEMTS
jgi:hypothetical protein